MKKKNLVKLPYSAQKAATESINLFFCFDLQPYVKIRFYKLGCKYLTALLTVKETRLKDPRYRQNKRERLYQILYLGTPVLDHKT
jgi:hypothetical protein